MKSDNLLKTQTKPKARDTVNVVSSSKSTVPFFFPFVDFGMQHVRKTMPCKGEKVLSLDYNGVRGLLIEDSAYSWMAQIVRTEDEIVTGTLIRT